MRAIIGQATGKKALGRINQASGRKIVTADLCRSTEEIGQQTTVRDYLKDHVEIALVRFVLFDSKTLAAYEEALKKLSVD